ncbi:MAG: hypothetical protein ACFB15_32445 [Cyclobacteriaceae bacterium]
MVDLEEYRSEIEHFLIDGISKFRREVGEPNLIGVYCCPWSGWISLNFNVKKKLSETKENCPDFEYVEFNMIDFESWADEYESEQPVWRYRNSIYQDNLDEGDAGLNRLFFIFMKELIQKMNTGGAAPIILLQLLDSEFTERITRQ